MNDMPFTIFRTTVPFCTTAGCLGLCNAKIDRLFEQSLGLPLDEQEAFDSDMAMAIVRITGNMRRSFYRGIRLCIILWRRHRSESGTSVAFGQYAASVASFERIRALPGTDGTPDYSALWAKVRRRYRKNQAQRLVDDSEHLARSGTGSEQMGAVATDQR